MARYSARIELLFSDLAPLERARAAQAYRTVRAGGDGLGVLFDIYHQQITEGSLINNITAGIDVIRYFHDADAAEASEYINHPVEGPANIFHRSFTAEHLAVSWAATYICRMDTKTEASAIPRCSISAAGWAAEIYRAMSSEKKHEKGMYGPINVIKLVSDNADKLRGLLILAGKCCFRAALMDYTVCINGIRRYKRWACLAKRSWASG